MGFFDKFRKNTAVDAEALRVNYISARQQNLSYVQRTRVQPGELNKLFTQTKKTTLEKVGDMDVPGELATLTKVLSDGGINIANMSLVRDRRGGSVMTIFEIDQPVPAAELEQLKAVPQVLGVIYYEKEDD